METFEDYIEDAIDQVSAWEILDEEFAVAVNAQARLMLMGEYAISEPDPWVTLAVHSHLHG